MASIKIILDSRDEYFGLERLSNVLKFISIRFCDENLPLIIDSIEDHEGDLTVTWLEKPLNAQKEIVESAWENESELKMNVHHDPE